VCDLYYSGGLVPANTWVSLRFLIMGPDPGTQHGKIWAPADPEPNWVNAYTPQPLGVTAVGNVRLRTSSAAPSLPRQRRELRLLRRHDRAPLDPGNTAASSMTVMQALKGTIP
jgi:hypothetical protein